MRCSDCKFLNRSVKQSACGAYRYGCTVSEDGYMSTWINSDNLLSSIGCDYKQQANAPKIKFVDDGEQLPGQMTIDDWLQSN